MPSFREHLANAIVRELRSAIEKPLRDAAKALTREAKTAYKRYHKKTGLYLPEGFEDALRKKIKEILWVNSVKPEGFAKWTYNSKNVILYFLFADQVVKEASQQDWARLASTNPEGASLVSGFGGEVDFNNSLNHEMANLAITIMKKLVGIEFGTNHGILESMCLLAPVVDYIVGKNGNPPIFDNDTSKIIWYSRRSNSNPKQIENDLQAADSIFSIKGLFKKKLVMKSPVIGPFRT